MHTKSQILELKESQPGQNEFQKTVLTSISLLKMTIESETRVKHSYIKLNLKYQIHVRTNSF